MKKACIASLLGLSLLTPSLAAAAVPPTIAFSARVADNGQPVAGTATFVFTLWDVATGGAAGTDDVWTETHSNVTVTDGVVSITLGDTTTSPPGNALPAFSGTPLWLEVKMTYNGTSSTFAPRMAVQSVPYAMRSGTVDNMPAAGTSGQGGPVNLTATDALMASATFTYPGNGYAFIMVQSSTAQNATTPNQILFCSVREDGATFVGFWWEAYKNDGFYGDFQSASTVKFVTAGAHSYGLYCHTNTGLAFSTQGQINVLYVPNSL